MAIRAECYARILFLFRKMEEEGFRDEDWMEIPREEGLDVISPPQVTNILRALAALSVGFEEDDSIIPEARRVESPIEA